MKKEEVRIVIIALDDEEGQFYKDLLSSHDYVTLESYSSIQDFKNDCLGKYYSGFIVDARTLIRSSAQEKEFFALLHEGFPLIQVRRNHEDNSLNCQVRGKRLGDLRGEDLLDHFISQDCWQMTPREVRVLPRKNIFLNTYLYSSEKGRPQKTNLWDISEAGCFILSTQQKRKGKRVWLMIKELSDKRRIRGEIKWMKSWGAVPDHLPGFGVSFEEITESQRTQIQEILTMEQELMRTH